MFYWKTTASHEDLETQSKLLAGRYHQAVNVILFVNKANLILYRLFLNECGRPSTFRTRWKDDIKMYDM